ncbi:peroxisomal membrane protein PEX14 [Nymphaea colorata]|nr:peroxisomal membrane protein PEX14 [Nymphaea colorata]XP_031476359.1 peroxisomal membrane protein PEX14 [Nymphaea colorata]XP_031476360.1 peroxisomal membrane protein PEX14 [Nymphaea colorata]XP_031476361.1 peroxisomal membrane protein PEX14 [Nymphaea colorata]
MGSESAAQPNLANGSESVMKLEEDNQHATGESLKENIENPAFVNTIPLREDQVQNAVKFLSHPKVKGSPVIYRRSFLEKKGLTKEEIDEAFRRVPDPPSNVSSAPVTSTQDAQSQPPSVPQPQLAVQTSKPSTVPPGVTTSASKTSLHWSHALLAVGLLAASGAGTGVLVKTVIVPRLKAWIRKVVSEDEDSGKQKNSRPDAIEEAVAAAKAAAAAAADVAKASHEILTARNEERKYFDLVTKLLDTQVGEMKSMHHALRKMEGTIDNSLTVNKQTEEKLHTESFTASKPAASASMESAAAPPHPKSYMDIVAMLQRGEKPPNIQEIDDRPPNPNQPLPNPRILPKPKPWEVNQTRTTYEVKPVSGLESNGSAHLNGGRLAGSTVDYSEPSWQRKTVKISEIEPERAQMQMADEVTLDDRPVHRGWVPPPPPPFAMPEAADAIRRPKSLIPKEQMVPHSGVTEEIETLGTHSSSVVSELKEVAELQKANVETSHMISSGSSSYSPEIEESVAGS